MSRWIDADTLKAKIPSTNKDIFDKCLLDAEEVKTLIDEAPSADVIPRDYYDKVIEELCKMHQNAIIALNNKHGKWIYSRDDGGFKQCKCSECLVSYGCMDTPFCPNCGADMRGGNDEQMD